MSTQQQKSDPKTAAKDVAAKAKAEASSTADDIKDAVADKADDVMDDVAAKADAHADDLRDAGAAFENNPYARQAAEQISDSLTQMASTLRDTDLSTLQNDVSAFARRNPLVFFGSAAALGFLAGRAVKASERADYQVSASDRHNYPSVPDAQRAYPDQNKHRWGYS
ncbi:hypothetical protein [Gymnodinialimonas ulvae]|uniref:hypothetical protein n=1 Tax=Gymnodinialimonas ulvae TaxID=3126504 RepID=UPI0030B1440D